MSKFIPIQQLDSLKKQVDILIQSNDSLNQKMDLVVQKTEALNVLITSGAEKEGGSMENEDGINLGLYVLIVVLLLGIMFILKNKLQHITMTNKKDFEPDYDDGKPAFPMLTQSDTRGLEDDNCLSSPCVAAVASGTRKNTNQDSFCDTYVKNVQARIIAVADGVGSSYKAEVASYFVAHYAVDLLKKAVEKDAKNIDFITIFDKIQEGLNYKIETEFAAELQTMPRGAFATTLIVGIDFPDRFVAAYVGNGSIWHVSGLFNTFPEMVCLPWNAVNMLSPNTIMDKINGKETLYKVFSYKGQSKTHKPTVLQISKLQEKPGEMFIITTDGVYTSDHAIAGKDDDGDIWIPTTKQFGLLHDALKEYVESSYDISDDSLHQALVQYLNDIRDSKVMDDDTTLGVFISHEAKTQFLESRNK